MLRTMIDYIQEQIAKHFNAFISIEENIEKTAHNVHEELLKIQERMQWKGE